MLTNGNLSQYFQQGLPTPFLGFAGTAALPQFNPQSIFAPLGVFGLNPAGLNPASGLELGAFASPWAGQSGIANPAQQLAAVLSQLAQQAVQQGTATHQIGAALHQLAQQINAIQQIVAQSLQSRFGYGTQGGQVYGNAAAGPFSSPQFSPAGYPGPQAPGWQGFGLSPASLGQNPFAQGPFAQNPYASAIPGGYGGRAVM